MTLSTVSINNLPKDILSNILGLVNRPDLARVSKMFNDITHQWITERINADPVHNGGGYLKSETLQNLTPSKVTPSTHHERILFIARTAKRVVLLCTLILGRFPESLLRENLRKKLLETTFLESLLKQSNGERFKIDITALVKTINKKFPPKQRFRFSAQRLTDAQKNAEITAFFQNHTQLVQSVTKLNFDYNNLGFFREELQQFTNLTDLECCRTDLFIITIDITHFSNLQSLKLNKNKLIELPSQIGKLTNLQQVFVSHNSISSLPQEIGQLINLQLFDVSFNNLSSLPREIGQLTNLQQFDVSFNHLSSLPREIGQLVNLENFFAGNNQIKTLPREIALLSNLIIFDVHNNNLSTLLPEIGLLTNLEVLNIKKNSLTTIPPQIGWLTHLQEFYIDLNQLTTLPPQIGMLSQLGWLSVRGNPIDSLPFEINYLNLHTLSLRNNMWIALTQLSWHQSRSTEKRSELAKAIEKFQATHPNCEVLL